METISIQALFKERVESLLEETNKENPEILKYGYVIPDLLIQDSILFIGLNPSFNPQKDTFRKLFYNLYQRKEHPYFAKFFDISDHCNHPWSHLDLFLVRETNQRLIKDWSKEPTFKDSLIKQFSLTRDMIYQVHPKIIVVCNTMAREWFRNKQENPLAFDLSAFDDNIGTYRIINDMNLKNVPIIFSSMLTGQRALDLGSFERLRWQIKYILSSINK